MALSLLNGIAGTVLLALFENEAYSVSYRIGAAVLQEGFPPLAILAVAQSGCRLLNLSTMEELRTPSFTWIARATLALITGLTIERTFVLEAFGRTSTAASLRVSAVIFYLVPQMPRIVGAFSVTASELSRYDRSWFVMEALWPQLRIAALHIVFITGSSFVILRVATRVIVGHSGNANLFTRQLPFHIAVATLIGLAMFSRFTAELAPRAPVLRPGRSATRLALQSFALPGRTLTGSWVRTPRFAVAPALRFDGRPMLRARR
ncbi:MAG: hypothetical protein JO076_04840 [Verrucomicrobia bacterium]|nr:hypothetical protein [Verrucomicrobiota bacterium]